MALTTLATAKDHLSIPVTNTDYDTRITRLIEVASVGIERYCQRTFSLASYTDTFDWFPNQRLIVAHYPVVTLTDVRVDTTRAFGVDTIVDAENYTYSPETGLIRFLNYYIPYFSQIIQANYDAGYATIPFDVEHACLLWVELLYKVVPDTLGKTSKSKQEETIAFIDGVPAIIKDHLDPYRRGDEWDHLGV